MTGVRKDGDIKNCTSKMWGGGADWGPQRWRRHLKGICIHSSLQPQTVKWKQLLEAVGGGQETPLTQFCEDSSHGSSPTSDLFCRPNICRGSCMAGGNHSPCLCWNVGLGGYRSGVVRMNPAEIKTELGLLCPKGKVKTPHEQQWHHWGGRRHKSKESRAWSQALSG